MNNGPNGNVQGGIVFKQDPTPGTKVDKGGTVTLWVSTGPPKVTVPAVKGESWAKAQADLVECRTEAGEVHRAGQDSGRGDRDRPGRGQSVPKGSKVRVNVSSGPKIAAVPSVVGLSIQDATAKLNAAGFNPNPSFVDSTAPQGQVVSQSPAPGTSEPQGTSVRLNVSNGPKQVTVPDVVGYTSQQAVSTLEAAGFHVQPTTHRD